MVQVSVNVRMHFFSLSYITVNCVSLEFLDMADVWGSKMTQLSKKKKFTVKLETRNYIHNMKNS